MEKSSLLTNYSLLTEGGLEIYEGKINDIFNHTGNVAKELKIFTDDTISMFIKNEEFMKAFMLIAYIFNKITTLKANYSFVNSLCSQQWMKILDTIQDKRLEDEMLQWFIHKIGEPKCEYIHQCLVNIIMKYFHESTQLKKKICLAEKCVSQSYRIMQSWCLYYQFDFWSKKYLQLVREAYKSVDIRAYSPRLWEIPEIRMLCADEYEKTGDYRRAIKIVRDCMSIDGQHAEYKYRLRLKELYKLCGDETSYKNELWNLVISNQQNTLELYKELRCLYTKEDWNEKREAIFARIKSGTIKIEDLYAEEGLYEQLLYKVQSSDGLELLEKYEHILKPNCEAELLEKYEMVVRNLAEEARVRQDYEHIVEVLKRMQKYKNGIPLVRQLVIRFRNCYEKRYTMMEELDKVPFS